MQHYDGDCKQETVTELTSKNGYVLLHACDTSCSVDTSFLCAADFLSAPNLTAAAAAQNLEWAPVSVKSLAVDSYSLTQSASSATALLNLTVSAELGVSGSLSDVATAGSSSGRRSLLSSTSKLYRQQQSNCSNVYVACTAHTPGTHHVCL